MSLANLSRWANVSLNRKQSTPPPHSANDSQGSLVSSRSDTSFGDSRASDSAGDFGTLIIIIMKAKNLYNKRAVSKQNPYCSVRIAKHSARTKAITRGGQAPLWDHEARFKLDRDDDNRQLKLCVFDQNGSNTEIIGDAQISLKQAYEAPSDIGHDGWYPIHFNKRYVGEVFLEMTFYPTRQSKRSSRRSSAASAQIAPISPFRNSAFGHSSSMENLHSTSPSRSVFGAPPLPPTHTAHPQPHQMHPATHPLPSVMHRSDSVPIIYEDNVLPVSRSSSPLSIRRAGRPLPRIPQEPARTPGISTAQEDIQRQINDGYEASVFERLKPSASQPFR